MNQPTSPQLGIEAIEFIREQSVGEWDDKTIREDVVKLVAFVERWRHQAREEALEEAIQELAGYWVTTDCKDHTPINATLRAAIAHLRALKSQPASG